jgi:N-acetylneuraminic acid mutarotase
VQKATVPAPSGSGSFCFAIGDFGYLGFTGSANNFWEYNPTTNTWNAKSVFPGPGRIFGASFSFGAKGYVGTGYASGHLDDFWEWDQQTDTWQQLPDFAGTARRDNVGFGIDGKGYIGTGYDGALLGDLWEWDPLTNSWSQKASITGLPRNVATAFTLPGHAFIGTGSVGFGGISTDELWQWSKATNTWTQKTDFPGGIREHAFSFSIGNKGYLGTGAYYGGSGSTIYYNDLWEYTPDSSIFIGLPQFDLSAAAVKLFPNPAVNEIFISGVPLNLADDVSLSVMDVSGKKLFENNLSFFTSGDRLQLDIGNFPQGTYLVVLSHSGTTIVRKFVKQGQG